MTHPWMILTADGDLRTVMADSGSGMTSIPALIDRFRRVLVTGSRKWDDAEAVWSALLAQVNNHGPITIVHGDCPSGADLMARGWTERRILANMQTGDAFVRHEPYPAYWNELGKSAGPIRNKYMVGLGADVCLAFPTPSSRGTISCMKLAHAASIPVINLGTLPEGVEFP